jgi:TfoX/Sxy family transcriptional regulator of competence genes
MAYNEKLADRVRAILAETTSQIDEKKMFGAVCFMVNGKMCVGVQKDQLMVRLNPAMVETLVDQEDCMPMDMNGKVMKGFVLVELNALNTNRKLEHWLKLALEYNPLAKAAKKKKA